MTELEKLARVIDPTAFSTWAFETQTDLSTEEKAESQLAASKARLRTTALLTARQVLQHLHDNVSEGMEDAMVKAGGRQVDLAEVYIEWRPIFQAAIASILED